MDNKLIERYAPIALVVAAIFIQFNLFVTPEKLERTHREIITEISRDYATTTQVNSLQNQLNDMQKKLDKIYDYIVSGRVK